MAELEGLDCTLVLEPGRVLVGNAGILVTKVLFTKEGEEKYFIIVDAGMNDLARPSLYGSFHGLQPVVEKNRREVKASLVGPICESGDFLAKDRMMPAFEPGELVAVMSAGAYGFTMSSNYNSRPRVPEILVHKNEFYVIRERETYEDIIRGRTGAGLLTFRRQLTGHHRIMNRMPFWKMQGSGNDFILIDHRRPFLAEAERIGLVKKLCAPKFGVGADGLILIEPSDKVIFAGGFLTRTAPKRKCAATAGVAQPGLLF